MGPLTPPADPGDAPAPGRVYLVGAGPWDPGLLTIRGAECLARADVVLYDHLANPELLDRHCRPEAERIFVGKRRNRAVVDQAEIERRLVQAARAGRTVVRLKGGDPFLFGRGGEEAEALAGAGVACEIVPGVSSALAVPAYAGIPLTDRRLASSVAIVTGHVRKGGDAVDLRALAGAADTIVLLMGLLQLRRNLAELVAGGLDPATPAAAVRWGARPDQRTVVGTVADLADAVEAAGLRPPAVVVVGRVVTARDRLSWFEPRPLRGRAVAITGSDASAEGRLRAGLLDAGAAVLVAPAIRIAGPADPGPLLLALSRLPDYDWLVLTSRNAVGALARHLDALDPAAGPKVACVGPSTARDLEERLHRRPDLVPDADFRAAMLAQALVTTGVKGRRILHLRGDLAPPDLAGALRAAGAVVEDPVAYRTAPAPPGDAPTRRLGEALEAGRVDALVLASGSAVDALVDALGADTLRKAGVRAAIGPVTAQALAARGLPAEVVPAASTADGLVAALIDHFAGPR